MGVLYENIIHDTDRDTDRDGPETNEDNPNFEIDKQLKLSVGKQLDILDSNGVWSEAGTV